MVDAVLGGDGLGRVADLAAEAARGPVAIVIPRLGAAAVSPGATVDVQGLRRYVGDRASASLRTSAASPRRPAEVPGGVAAEVPISSGDEVIGAVLLLGAGPPASE